MTKNKQPIKTCLFFPIQKGTSTQKTNNRHINKVKKLDIHTLNEIKVANFLKIQTEDLQKYCNTFSSFELLGVSALNDKYLERSERLQNSPGFALFRYSPPNTVNFFDQLYKCCEPRMYIHYLIIGFKGFLSCIHFFQSHKIVHLSWSPQNMLYNPETRGHLVQDLSSCLILDKISREEKAFHLSQFQPTHYFLPIEFHVISYIIQNKESSISTFKIDAIITSYIDAHPHIKKFSKTFAESYRKECEASLYPYINKPAEYIVDTIMQTSAHTWDAFALSSTIINIIFGLKTACEKGAGWLDRVLKLLLLNTYPRVEKRKTIAEIVALFDAICNNDAAIDDLKIMITSLNADSLKKVNQHLLECNRFIVEACESRKKRCLMSAGLATRGALAL
jgi:hypothetical protein